MYVRHPKSASSSITQYFKECGHPRLKGAVDVAWRGGTSRAKPSNVTHSQTGRTWQDKGGRKQRHLPAVKQLRLGAACLQPQGRFAADLSPVEARSMWSDYFVFSVVRNPYARFLSAYKFLLHKVKGGGWGAQALLYGKNMGVGEGPSPNIC